MLTYEVKPDGKKFKTICSEDGLTMVVFMSKNMKSAKKKGEEYLSGIRTSVYEYKNDYGRYLDMISEWEKREDFLDTMYPNR